MFLATCTIVGFGAAVRLRQWSWSRSLWLDEASLALSFDRFDLFEIVTQRLVARQSGPPGFLFTTELSVQLFGRGERSLRLVALIAGLASIAVAVVVAHRLLSNALARLAFIALVALSPTLIYYSNEVKQYSVDVLAILVVLLMWSMRTSSRRTVLMAISGFAVSLFSLVGIVGLGSLVLAFVIEKWRTRRRGTGEGTRPNSERPALLGRRGLAVIGVWALGIALHGAYTLNAGVDREWMREWWTERGAFPPVSMSELDWYVQSLQRLSWIGIGDHERLDAVSGTGSLLLVGIVVVLAALAIAFRRDVRLLVFSLLALVWILAEMSIYPTSGRLSLYLVPIVFVAVAAGFDVILSKMRAIPNLLAVGAVGLLLFQQMSATVPRIVEPLDDRDMRWVAQQLAGLSRPTDEIVNAPFGSAAAWYGLPSLVEKGNYSNVRVAEDLPSRITLTLVQRVWVVSTHNPMIAMELVSSMAAYGYQSVCVNEFEGTYLALLVRRDEVSAFDFDRDCRISNAT